MDLDLVGRAMARAAEKAALAEAARAAKRAKSPQVKNFNLLEKLQENSWPFADKASGRLGLVVKTGFKSCTVKAWDDIPSLAEALLALHEAGPALFEGQLKARK